MACRDSPSDDGYGARLCAEHQAQQDSKFQCAPFIKSCIQKRTLLRLVFDTAALRTIGAGEIGALLLLVKPLDDLQHGPRFLEPGNGRAFEPDVVKEFLHLDLP